MDARLIIFEKLSRGELEYQVNNFLVDNVGAIVKISFHHFEPNLHDCYLVYYPIPKVRKNG